MFSLVVFFHGPILLPELLVKELGESRNEVARLASEMNQLLEDIGALGLIGCNKTGAW